MTEPPQFVVDLAVSATGSSPCRKSSRGVVIFGVHVKVVGGALVAGGPPSCELCSKEILDAGYVDLVWLYEAQRWTDERDCIHCRVPHRFVDREDDAEDCPRCGGELAPTTTRQYDPSSGLWKQYDALGFHEATLSNRSLPTKKSSL